MADVDAALEGTQKQKSIKPLARIDILERLVGKLQAQQLLDHRRRVGASQDAEKAEMAQVKAFLAAGVLVYVGAGNMGNERD